MFGTFVNVTSSDIIKYVKKLQEGLGYNAMEILNNPLLADLVEYDMKKSVTEKVVVVGEGVAKRIIAKLEKQFGKAGPLAHVFHAVDIGGTKDPGRRKLWSDIINGMYDYALVSNYFDYGLFSDCMIKTCGNAEALTRLLEIKDSQPKTDLGCVYKLAKELKYDLVIIYTTLQNIHLQTDSNITIWWVVPEGTDTLWLPEEDIIRF